MSGKTLSGRTSFITGSSRGIGKAIAEHLASCGSNVIIHGSTSKSSDAFGESSSLESLAETIHKTYGVRAIALAADLTDSSAVRKVVADAIAHFGKIDILINCAGGDIGAKGVLAENAGKPIQNDALNVSYDDIDVIIRRNLMSCIYMCKECVPAMIERREGWVVSIGSDAGLVGRTETAIYCTAKAAMHEYTRCLAAMCRPYGVNVNVLAPGDIITERFKASRPLSEERLKAADSLERYGTTIEIARVVEFLVTQESSYITGQVIRVDGGKQIWPS